MISKDEENLYRELANHSFFNPWVMLKLIVLVCAAIAMFFAPHFDLSLRLISWIGCAYLCMLVYQEIQFRLELVAMRSAIKKLLDDYHAQDRS